MRIKNTKLISLMKKKKITQQNIADLLQISRRSVNAKVNGKLQFKEDELITIANLFNTSIDYLIGNVVLEHLDEGR